MHGRTAQLRSGASKLLASKKHTPAPSPSRAAAIRNLDEFEDAVILKTFGRVPEDFGATDSA